MFYNIYIPDGCQRCTKIVRSQLLQVGNESYREDGGAGPIVVYYNTIGKPKVITDGFMQHNCQVHGLRCIRLNHYDEGFEDVTVLTQDSVMSTFSNILATLTAAGALVGTPLYMAPEIISGDFTSPAADVWATGVLLYLLLTGKPPFEGTTPMQIVIVRNIDSVSYAIAPPTSVAARITSSGSARLV